MLLYFKEKRKATVHEIQQLAGFLNFLNKAIIPGRAFTRRMYAKVKDKARILKSYHHINLDREFRSDCSMWLEFLTKYEEQTVCRPMIDFAENVIA